MGEVVYSQKPANHLQRIELKNELVKWFRNPESTEDFQKYV